MKKILTGLGLGAALLFASTPANAVTGLSWTYSVPGVINNGTIATFIACTNGNTTSVTVGVEIYQADGTLLNTASTTAISVGPNATVLFGTTASNPATLAIDANLAPGAVTKGSAHIVTSGTKIFCSAFLADPTGNPPVAMTTLSIIKKASQRGQ